MLGIARIAHASVGPTFQGQVQTLSTGGSITLSSPAGIVVDTSGNSFIVDTGNSRIVEVTAQGVASVLTISGLSPALASPAGIAIDGSGNLYIADVGNSRVVKVTAAGVGSAVDTGSVVLSSPKGVALDQSGDLFIADTGNSRIVEVTAGGSASALSITGLSSPSTLNTPIGVATDVSGNLYFADSVNNRIVKVVAGGTAGTVLAIAGVELNAPSGVYVDGIGNVYIADTGNSRIAEIDTAGNGTVLYTGSVTLSGALGISVDVFGTVYIADTGHNRGLIVNPPINANVVSGNPTYSLNKSVVGFGHVQLGSSTAVTQTLAFTIGSTALGSVKVFTSGVQSLDFTAGTDTTCNSSTGSSATCSVEVQFLSTAPGLRAGAVVLYDGAQNPILTLPLYGYGDSPVAALAPNTATVIGTGGVINNYPFQLALDGAGNMYVGNYAQSSTNPKVVKIAAGGGSASAVSTASVTLGQSVTGIALDGAGNLFIADYYNDRIVVVTPGGVASVLSISGLSPALGEPTELAFDAAGNLYIADYSPNARIVRVSSLSVSGSTSSGLGEVIHTGSYTFSGSSVTGVAVGPNGSIYIAARTSNTSHVVQVTAAGVASLLNPTGFTFSDPQGAFVDAMGNLYVEDSGNSRIVRITAAGVAAAFSLSGLTSPSTLSSGFGVTADGSGNLYIPDWTNNRVVLVNVSGAALTFTSTPQGSTSTDSPKTATVTNLGNQPLAFSTNPTYTANFSNNAGDTNSCTSSTSLLTGTLCDVSVKFTPQSVGSLSAGIAVTDDTLNVAGSTQQVSVSGIALSSSDTTSTTVASAPTSLPSGQTATITATVSDTTTGHTSTIPTGPVTFTDTLGSTTTSLNGGTAISLSGGKAILTGAVLSGVGTHTIAANYAGVTGSFAASIGSTTVQVSAAAPDTTSTTVASAPTSLPSGQTATIAATVSDTTTGHTSTIPTGPVTFTDTLGSTTTSLNGGTAISLSGGKAILTGAVLSGAGTHTIAANYAGVTGSFAASSGSTTVQVSVAAPTINWNPAATSITYGATLAGILNASAVSGSTAVAGAFTYTATLAGGSAVTVTSATILGAGTYSLTASFTPTNTATYQSVSKVITFTVNKATPGITLTSSVNPVLSTNPTTLTATVSSTLGTPTGTVSFLDGTTPLGQGTLSGGIATLTTASLSVGTHTITAVSSGDANFVAATSGALTQAVLDFSLGSPGSGSGTPPSQTVVPGGSATYALNIVPTSGTVLPAPLILSLSGMPTGATAVLAPSAWTQVTTTSWSYPANVALVATSLTIQLPTATASLEHNHVPGGRVPPLLWGVLLLPFTGKLRRAGTRLRHTGTVLLLFVAAMVAVGALSGCGSSTGLFSQQQQTYTVTVTATTGTLSHSTTVTLTVE